MFLKSGISKDFETFREIRMKLNSYKNNILYMKEEQFSICHALIPVKSGRSV